MDTKITIEITDETLEWFLITALNGLIIRAVRSEDNSLIIYIYRIILINGSVNSSFKFVEITYNFFKERGWFDAKIKINVSFELVNEDNSESDVRNTQIKKLIREKCESTNSQLNWGKQKRNTYGVRFVEGITGDLPINIESAWFIVHFATIRGFLLCMDTDEHLGEVLSSLGYFVDSGLENVYKTLS